MLGKSKQPGQGSAVIEDTMVHVIFSEKYYGRAKECDAWVNAWVNAWVYPDFVTPPCVSVCACIHWCMCVRASKDINNQWCDIPQQVIIEIDIFAGKAKFNILKVANFEELQLVQRIIKSYTCQII